MMPRKNQQRKKFPAHNGFTLVEMMIVVLIIGILSSVSVPPMFRYVATHRLQTNTDRMASDMQYARSMAVSKAQVVNFSTTLTGYTLTDAVNGNTIRTVELDDGVVMGANYSVMFYPWGMADDETFGISSGAGAYEISLLPTGVVEVTLQ